MNQEIEIWKDVLGYESLYEVSNLGRVKSLWFKEPKILKPSVSVAGYYVVSLCLDSVKKSKRVNRLVAEAFLGESDLLVNHKDGNKLNNNLSNLEYVSNRDNQIHRYKNQNTSSKYTGVHFRKDSLKWRAIIGLNGKSVNLGCFNTELEAYNAYLKALKENNIKSKYA